MREPLTIGYSGNILALAIEKKYSLTGRCCHALLCLSCSLNTLLQLPCSLSYMPVAFIMILIHLCTSEERSPSRAETFRKGIEKYCFPIESANWSAENNGATYAFFGICCSPIKNTGVALREMVGPTLMR